MTFSKLGTDTQTGQIVELPQASRRQGLYIIGANGTGKTGLIENLILQDIDQGLGVGLLDPHGDLTNAILSKMTKRLDDVILLDITDEKYPFGLNIFECHDPTDSVAVQKIVDLVMHIFEKIFDVSRAGTPLLLDYLPRGAQRDESKQIEKKTIALSLTERGKGKGASDRQRSMRGIRHAEGLWEEESSSVAYGMVRKHFREGHMGNGLKMLVHFQLG